MPNSRFQSAYAFGHIAETQIAAWLMQRGWAILPAYEKEIDTGKGPQLFTEHQQLIVPDLLAIKGNSVKWIEAKHKTRFSWYGKKQRWETGIDAHHFEHYQQVAEIAPWPIYLLFLHRSSQADQRDVERWDCPCECPTGLFFGEITALAKTKRFGKEWGYHGMVYWGIGDTELRRAATLNEVAACRKAA